MRNNYNTHLKWIWKIKMRKAILFSNEITIQDNTWISLSRPICQLLWEL